MLQVYSVEHDLDHLLLVEVGQAQSPHWGYHRHIQPGEHQVVNGGYSCEPVAPGVIQLPGTGVRAYFKMLAPHQDLEVDYNVNLEAATQILKEGNL